MTPEPTVFLHTLKWIILITMVQDTQETAGVQVLKPIDQR
jgi:hypothetical protein